MEFKMRATTVAKAKKDQGNCSKCGDPIPAGSPYSWTQAFRGPKIVRCAKVECRLRPSDLASNDKLARLYEIQEEIEDLVVDDETTLEDVKEMCDDWAQRADEVGDDYEESAQSIEDGFGHATFQSDEMTENAEAARDWGQSFSNADLPEEWDPEKARRAAREEIEDASDEADLERQIEYGVEEKRSDWEQQIMDVLGDISGELSL